MEWFILIEYERHVFELLNYEAKPSGSKWFKQVPWMYNHDNTRAWNNGQTSDIFLHLSEQTRDWSDIVSERRLWVMVVKRIGNKARAHARESSIKHDVSLDLWGSWTKSVA